MGLEKLTHNEKNIINIINFNSNNDNIWVDLQTLINKSGMSLMDLELTLYILQMKRLIRIIQDSTSYKITTEDKVSVKLNERINKTTSDIEKEMLIAVDNEDYEKASEYRDLIKMVNENSSEDEIVEAILKNIN